MSDITSDITVNFTKDNGNIVLESIIQDNEPTFYTSNKPLLTVDEDGKMNKVEGVDLNEIISSVAETPAKSEEIVTEEPVTEIVEPVTEEIVTEEPAVTPETEVSTNPFDEEIAKEERQKKEEELNKAFEQAEEEKKKKEQLINEPVKKEIKKPISLIDEMKNSKMFRDRQNIQGGKKNRTKKSIKAGKKKSRKVRFIMTKKRRQNKKNRTRR
jgi:hypothetical protein